MATPRTTNPPASNIEWQSWARRDPLYAVATCQGKDKDGPSPWTDDEFYALGKSDWDDFHKRWRHYGMVHSSCVEIGCGAGRITRYLASTFKTVHAFDISPDMLQYARKRVPQGNVTFYLSDGAHLDLPDDSVTGAFSCHVFQHFDALQAAHNYFLEIYRVLAEKGTLMIHLPIYSWPYPSKSFSGIYNFNKMVSDAKAALNRRLIQADIFRPLMRRLTYPMSWFFDELPRMGFSEVELAVIAPESSHDPHAFVLARKPESHPQPGLERCM